MAYHMTCEELLAKFGEKITKNITVSTTLNHTKAKKMTTMFMVTLTTALEDFLVNYRQMWKWTP